MGSIEENVWQSMLLLHEQFEIDCGFRSETT
jgi:hypothetical protein